MNEHDLTMRAGCAGGPHIRGETNDCAHCREFRGVKRTWPSMDDDILQDVATTLAWARAQTERPCSDCDGIGHSPGWPHTTCPTCRGNGVAVSDSAG